MRDQQQGMSKSHQGLVIGGVSVAAILIAAAAAVAVAPNWAGTGDNVPAAISTSTSAAPTPTPTTASNAPEPTVAAGLAYNAFPADGAAQVNPVTAPEIRAEGGVIESVTLRTAGGEPVTGTLSEDNSVWTATDRLAFATGYIFEFVLSDADGNAVTESHSFSTVMPANEADAAMYPRDGSTVGTGQPIEINFSEPVIIRDEVESAITVTSSSGQTGAFYWLSDTKVRYRAEEFWAPNSTITVDMELFGVDYGNEMIGNFDDQLVFNTHNTRLAVVRQ
ncbi:Ig-like domain-containing protein [Arthrobacter sp. CAN_C5]|uniref:Ig-like domain-containing protein n=1 Tax=Arthrobacter sp. CAN_C5 TaxID=2760706 RepID=UPI001AE55F01|nr:Ig-like domain-containing protein [Arthrobacter sp. CAN_C5]MBP2217778.1 hypothetical protein [Arthrobacter sp. CAN_C5]